MTFTEPASTPLALLLLGRDSDLASERGVDCPGDLPPASDPDAGGPGPCGQGGPGRKVFVLGHHYQRDEVIQFADVTGDSFKLARDAAARPDAEYIVFCGVHFMAESADILTTAEQHVVLPDLAAGCSMADMADYQQVVEAWDVLADAGVADVTVPITYMNSSAAIKAFTGEHGGAVCTSSNAERALRWAFGAAAGGGAGGEKVLFLPDQHLGRNTAVRQLGIGLDDCVVFNPHKPGGGLTAAAAPRREDDPLAGPLLGARPVHRRQCRRRPGPGARRERAGAPRVPARGGPGRRLRRLDRVHHQDPRRGARGRRHGPSAPS